MARRRSKKSTLARRVEAWRKLPQKTVGKVLAYRPPHSSVFVIGLGIGLAVGLSVGVGITWLDGRRAPAPIQTQVAEVAPPPATKPAQAVPPAYVEQTEPQPPEAEEAPPTET